MIHGAGIAALAERLTYSDVDEENRKDVFQSPEYAADIFNYYGWIEVSVVHGWMAVIANVPLAYLTRLM